MSSMIPSPAIGRPPLRLTLMAAAAGLALAAASPACAMVGEDYEPEQAPVATTWYAPADPAALRADRDYVARMRTHHAGALTMSEEYLADPRASSLVLRRPAQAIILTSASRSACSTRWRPTSASSASPCSQRRPRAWRRRGASSRNPFPAPAALLAPGAPVTERDVQFAKAMTIHQQGALDTARAYNANPHARNGFLRLLNIDIIADQSQEIALMRSVIAAYPGDPDTVRVDPSMVHGMEGMGHGSDHAGRGGLAGHGATAPAAQAEAGAATPPPAAALQAGQAGPQPRAAHLAPRHRQTAPASHQSQGGHVH